MNVKKHINHTVSVSTLFFIGLLFSAGVVGAFSLFGNNLSRTDGQGAVTVTVTYMAPKDSETRPDKTSFQIALDTHSVNLGQYDLEKLTFIQFDDSEPVSGGTWKASGSGHHFRGELSFDRIIPAGTKTMRLLIRGIDNVDNRVFEWDLS